MYEYFRLFFSYAGFRLITLSTMIFLGGITEGLGLGLFLPLLNSQMETEVAGLLGRAIYGFIEVLGMDASLKGTLFLIAVVFLGKGVITCLVGIYSAKIQADLRVEFRQGLARAYSKADYRFYTNTNMGHLNNLVTKEVDRAVGGFNVFCKMLVNFIQIGVYLVGASLLDWKISGMAMGSFLLLLLSFTKINALAKRISHTVTEKNSQILSLLMQVLYNFKYLKATDSFDLLLGELRTKIGRHARLEFKLASMGAFTQSVVEPFAILFMCVLIFVHVFLWKGNLAEIVVLLMFFYKSFTRVFGFQMWWQKFNACLGGVHAVKSARQKLAKNREPDQEKEVRYLKEGIRLAHVSFAYEDKPVLHGVDLTIKKHSCVGIVGESGSGKTTLFDLITCLLVPQQGDILVDGTSYSAIRKGSLRSLIGYVTQEPVIFNDTISNNISFWDPDPDSESLRAKICNAARMAHCEDFILGSDNGFDTIIGEKGVKLSGGQRQRIAIARELYKNPEIIIFDEATSALDTQSEKNIQASISEMQGSRTLIIIAHRLSTIRLCDCIHVLSKGRIVQSGAFSELYHQRGKIFRNLCDAQQMTAS